jgi:hypothetical protein
MFLLDKEKNYFTGKNILCFQVHFRNTIGNLF